MSIEMYLTNKINLYFYNKYVNIEYLRRMDEDLVNEICSLHKNGYNQFLELAYYENNMSEKEIKKRKEERAIVFCKRDFEDQAGVILNIKEDIYILNTYLCLSNGECYEYFKTNNEFKNIPLCNFNYSSCRMQSDLTDVEQSRIVGEKINQICPFLTSLHIFHIPNSSIVFNLTSFNNVNFISMNDYRFEFDITENKICLPQFENIKCMHKCAEKATGWIFQDSNTDESNSENEDYERYLYYRACCDICLKKYNSLSIRN